MWKLSADWKQESMLGGHQDNLGNAHYTRHAWGCVPKTLISPERNKEENTVSWKKGNCCRVILEYSHRETGQRISTQLSTENGNFHSVNSLSRILNDYLLVICKRSWGYLRNTAQKNHGPIIKSKLEMRHVMTWRRWAEGSTGDKVCGLFFPEQSFWMTKGKVYFGGKKMTVLVSNFQYLHVHNILNDSHLFLINTWIIANRNKL